MDIFPQGVATLPELLLAHSADSQDVSMLKKVYRVQRMITVGDLQWRALQEQILTTSGQPSLESVFQALLGKVRRSVVKQKGLQIYDDNLVMFMERKYDFRAFSRFLEDIVQFSNPDSRQGPIVSFALTFEDLAYVYKGLEGLQLLRQQNTQAGQQAVLGSYQYFQTLFDTQLRRDFARLYCFKTDFGAILTYYQEIFEGPRIQYERLIRFAEKCKSWTIYSLLHLHQFVSEHCDGRVIQSSIADLEGLRAVLVKRFCQGQAHCMEVRKVVQLLDVFLRARSRGGYRRLVCKLVGIFHQSALHFDPADMVICLGSAGLRAEERVHLLGVSDVLRFMRVFNPDKARRQRLFELRVSGIPLDSVCFRAAIPEPSSGIIVQNSVENPSSICLFGISVLRLIALARQFPSHNTPPPDTQEKLTAAIHDVGQYLSFRGVAEELQDGLEVFQELTLNPWKPEAQERAIEQLRLFTCPVHAAIPGPPPDPEDIFATPSALQQFAARVLQSSGSIRVVFPFHTLLTLSSIAKGTPDRRASALDLQALMEDISWLEGEAHDTPGAEQWQRDATAERLVQSERCEHDNRDEQPGEAPAGPSTDQIAGPDTPWDGGPPAHFEDSPATARVIEALQAAKVELMEARNIAAVLSATNGRLQQENDMLRQQLVEQEAAADIQKKAATQRTQKLMDLLLDAQTQFQELQEQYQCALTEQSYSSPRTAKSEPSPRHAKSTLTEAPQEAEKAVQKPPPPPVETDALTSQAQFIEENLALHPGIPSKQPSATGLHRLFYVLKTPLVARIAIGDAALIWENIIVDSELQTAVLIHLANHFRQAHAQMGLDRAEIAWICQRRMRFAAGGELVTCELEK